MIEKIYRNKYMVRYTITCDNCRARQECSSWSDLLAFMNYEGWKTRFIDGEWKHFCPECVESEVEHDA